MGLSYMEKEVPNTTSKKQNGDTYKESTGEEGGFKKKLSKQGLQAQQTNRRGTIQIDEDSSDMVNDTIMAAEGNPKKTGSFQELMSINKNDLKQ